MAGYFFRYVAPKIAKNLAERRKTQDEVFKSIDEKGKGLSLQKRSNIKKSFSEKASKIYDKASKTRKGKMGGGMMGRRMGYKSGMSVKGDNKRDIRKTESMIGASKSSKREKGKTKFGMLSVKAGIDKNPNPTLADRIAGAKMKKGKA